MTESLDLLIQLQAVDSQLMEIEEQKGDLPARVERLEQELKDLAAGTAEKSARQEAIVHESNQHQGSIDDAREHLKKYQEQLLLVATNRAYDALTTEIDDARKTIDDGEFKLLELSDEQQSLADGIKSDELLERQKRDDLAAQQKALEATLAETEKLSKSLARKRKALKGKIEDRILDTYERIRGARDGLAVVPVSRNACGVCFHRLPPQQQMEIKAMDRIITCESCGVILHWVEE
ncbi:MAG: C4-type zinc ribbon domain-containing protein [Candidatus Neomarinimicrobiota bacterium]